MQKIIIISALSDNYVIGNNGGIPWHIKEEFEHFKNATNNHIVLMGKNTWKSLPESFRPLPNRVNIVLSKEKVEEDCKVFSSMRNAFDFCKKFPEKTIFICGGAGVYKQTIDLCDEMILSWIKKEYDGDTYFPKFDLDKFRVVNIDERKDFVVKYYAKN